MFFGCQILFSFFFLRLRPLPLQANVFCNLIRCRWICSPLKLQLISVSPERSDPSLRCQPKMCVCVCECVSLKVHYSSKAKFRAKMSSIILSNLWGLLHYIVVEFFWYGNLPLFQHIALRCKDDWVSVCAPAHKTERDRATHSEGPNCKKRAYFPNK